MKTLMTCMLRNHRQEDPLGLVDLLEDGRVVWHATDSKVLWRHGDFLTPTSGIPQ
jgi:hypothetical protein